MSKKLPTIIICVFIFGIVYPQHSKPIYLDANGKTTSINNAKFYQLTSESKNEQKLYELTEFFISGEKRMEGFVKNKKKMIKSGDFIYYYKNGAVSSKLTYKKNKKEGEAYIYYLNGQVCQKRYYNKDKYEIISSFDSTGNQTYSDRNGIVYFLSDNGDISKYCEYRDGKKNGICRGPFEKEGFFIDKYENGEFISA